MTQYLWKNVGQTGSGSTFINIPRKPSKFIGELTGYQKGFPSLCLWRPARAPLPSCWLPSFEVESGLGSGYLPFEPELLTLRFSTGFLQC